MSVTRMSPNPCRRCGSHERYISSGKCLQCTRKNNAIFKGKISAQVFELNEREALFMRKVRYEDVGGNP